MNDAEGNGWCPAIERGFRDGASAQEGLAGTVKEVGGWSDLPPMDGMGGGGSSPAAPGGDAGSTDSQASQSNGTFHPIALRARPQVWSQARTEKLLELRAEGKTAKQCGIILGVSKSAVKGRLERLKITRVRPTIWDETNINLLTELWASGASGSFIGRKVGTSRSSVIGKVHRLGLASRATSKNMRISSRPKSRPTRIRVGKKLLPLAIPKPTPMPVAPLNIPLWDLQSHHCREVVGHDGIALFCGLPKANKHTSFCAWHHSINYEPVKARNVSLFHNYRRAA